PEFTGPFALGDDPAQTLDNEDAQSRSLSRRDLFGFFQYRIGNLYGCLHMAICITSPAGYQVATAGLVRPERSLTAGAITCRPAALPQPSPVRSRSLQSTDSTRYLA